MDKYSAIIKKAQSLIKDPFLINSKVSTHAIHSGYDAFEHAGTGYPVIPPISLSTTFTQKEPNCPIKYDYTRAGNYNRDVLESTIASLENAKYCCTFSSGLATLSSITQLLQTGDHVLFFQDVYGGTNRYFKKVAAKFNINSDPVDMQDETIFVQALRPNTKMIWIETPSNPMMRLIDIKKITELSRKHNPSMLVVVDNTFLTPVFQLPLKHGADIVMHSLTKYMNGHSDVLMGAAAMNDKALYQSLQQQQLMVGAVPSAFDCYLTLRGLRTLVVRMSQHQMSGLTIALYLNDHPKVEKVLHPGLFSPADKELADRQMTGFSGMLSFYVKGSTKDAVTFLQSLKYFKIAESLGGFESLAEIPSLMTHASVPPDQRAKLGITDNLIRMSVGLENLHDILEDLEQALNKI